MTSCYLTIDDSPSTMTDDMIDYLIERQIYPLLFIRGALAKNNPEPIIRAIKSGFVIGNHSYNHIPFGGMSYNECVADIEQCEDVIDNLYKGAGIKRDGKYFRFPYLDRGNGDRIERHFETVSDADINLDRKVQNLQSYLHSNGFTQPFKTNHPLYKNESIAGAADCLMTYTSFDWMVTQRHVGRWNYKSIDDLKTRIDDDDYLNQSSGNILIFHDQNDLGDAFKTLIDHMILKGYEFLDISTNDNRE
jgi:peptidoglycan/xylan/chitin deacetylase (PgdA/CDA1 family)